MNARIKKLWVAALRSGKYKQGHGGLRDGDRFCCLGVLCDIHAKETGTQWSVSGCYQGLVGFVPLKVMTWAEVSSSPHAGNLSLVNANDDRRLSFKKIAALIKEHL